MKRDLSAHIGCKLYQIWSKLDVIYHQSMGFGSDKKVWVMGYGLCMGYEPHFSANQFGPTKKVWVMPKYGLWEVWVIGGLTVYDVSPKV